MMQTGGDQEALQEAVDKQTEHIGALDEVCHGRDTLLNNRPYNVGHGTKDDGCR
jgi:hypothetical protein